MTRYNLLLIFAVTANCFGFSLFGQELWIKEKDAERPIAGASVRLSGDQTDYISNSEGKIQLPRYIQERILVSHMAFLHVDTVLELTPTKAIATLYLQPNARELEEVYVYDGYRKIPARERVGSFDFITEKEIQQRTAPNLLDRLDGMLSGVMFDRTRGVGNSPANLRVRGLSTINGSQQPLIILDDFPYEGEITNIDPNNIATVTVLKDAAATSIWGARAGNGVIVITTKKGSFDRPAKVSVLSNLSIQQKPDLRYASTMDPSSFIDVERFLFDKGLYNSRYTSRSRPGLTPVIELLQQHKSGSLSDAELHDKLGILRSSDVYDDLDRYVYDRGIINQNRVGIDGGTNKLAWNLSAAYNISKDELANANRRLSLQSGQQFKITDWLTGTMGINYTEQVDASGRQGISNFSNSAGDLYPYAELADEQGNPLPLVRFFRMSYLDELEGLPLQDWRYYPLEDHKHQHIRTRYSEIYLNPGIQISLPRGFDVSLKYVYQRQGREVIRDYGAESFFTRDLINKFTQIGTDGVPRYNIPLGGIYDQTGGSLNVHNVRNQLGYQLRTNRFNIAAISGFELRQAVSTSSGSRLYGFSADRYTHTEVNPLTPFPNYVTGSNQFIPTVSGISKNNDRFVSYYGNGSVEYAGKYTLVGSFRKDASNFFGVNANDKWNPLWSIGGAWDITKETFYTNSQLPYLKLRTTYGTSGNMAFNMVAATTIRYRTNSPYTGEQTAEISNFENPDLQWETVKTFNAGLDFASKNNRISGSLEWYRKTGENLFGSSPMDYTAGIGTRITKNVASMKGAGVDVNLKSQNFVGRFGWNTHMLLSFNKDEITDYYLSNTFGNNFVGRVNTVSGVVGKPVHSMMSYRWAGLSDEDGRAMGFIDGEVSDNYASITGSGTDVTDLHYHGPTLPRFFGALSNSFSYGGFRIDMRFTFKLRYYLRKSTIEYYNLVQRNTTHSDYENRWKNPGDEVVTDIPAFIYPATSAAQNFYVNAEPNVYDGSMVRLQHVNLNYAFAESAFWKNKKIDLRCFASIENVGILWRANTIGLDPQAGFQSLGSFPAPRVVTIGFTSTF
ncbi:SusC/RagA family TonB-linked outer membrane protein [Sphingobacterium olei]|uniref:SusC/RagA family TonB-linked outer membrane protein n=1 Tax=Sphingobacterium olei TaxID=2571155 RepID=A0A4U0NJ38_9SPHI|nr:SusC/RagA family TonB-linked outer membrane protein [Sphingobacterium olei]TJZ49904.1 SusC/RagA family TonB-linked outer membrane protein [Sphingobacterium olei]